LDRQGWLGWRRSRRLLLPPLLLYRLPGRLLPPPNPTPFQPRPKPAPPVIELEPAPHAHDAPIIGACAVDAAAGTALLGAWRDDEARAPGLGGFRGGGLVLPHGWGLQAGNSGPC
jgi:hypothetical protein